MPFRKAIWPSLAALSITASSANRQSPLTSQRFSLSRSSFAATERTTALSYLTPFLFQDTELSSYRAG